MGKVSTSSCKTVHTTSYLLSSEVSSRYFKYIMSNQTNAFNQVHLLNPTSLSWNVSEENSGLSERLKSEKRNPGNEKATECGDTKSYKLFCNSWLMSAMCMCGRYHKNLSRKQQLEAWKSLGDNLIETELNPSLLESFGISKSKALHWNSIRATLQE